MTVEVNLPEELIAQIDKISDTIHCDELMSVEKPALTDYVGSLGETKLQDLNLALLVATGHIEETGTGSG